MDHNIYTGLSLVPAQKQSDIMCPLSKEIWSLGNRNGTKRHTFVHITPDRFHLSCDGKTFVQRADSVLFSHLVRGTTFKAGEMPKPGFDSELNN